MTPILIQTDAHLIDISKLTHAELSRKDGRIKFHFIGGTSLFLSHQEADVVLVALGDISRCPGALIARRVGGAT